MFDKFIDRTGSNSAKYEYRKQLFGDADVIPLWVADMDFASPPCVSEALQKRLSHPLYGYTKTPDSLIESICSWQESQHGWHIKKEWVVILQGVVPSLSFSILAFSDPGESVLLQPPVYYPFFDVIERNHRQIIRNPLVCEDGRFQMDLEGLKNSITADAKMLLLSSPHNPGGSVWQADELSRLGEICRSNGITIISDEIHADLVHPGHTHVPIASLSQDIADVTVTVNSPGKTFNIPGLGISYAIISNDSLRRRFLHTIRALQVEGANLMGQIALEAAYKGGKAWLDALMQYLEGNRRFIREYLEEEMPEIKGICPESTYLYWLDFNATVDNDDALKTLLFEKAGLGLSLGKQFGFEGSGCARLNFAAPKSVIEEAMERLKKAL